MKTEEYLKNLSMEHAVSGHEKGFADFLASIFKEYCDEVVIDRFYNVTGIKKGDMGSGKRIMVTAHSDEIGFLVNRIDERGFIMFTPVGGVDPKILLAQEVVIHGKKEVNGVIGAKPPHLLKPEDAKKAVNVKDLSIDTGMSVDEIKSIVSIGDIITFRPVPFELKNGRVSSKSMDNRCGITVLINAMKRIARIRRQADTYFVATVQEEFILAGAVTAAYNIRPDVAIVIDACHGDMPDAPKDDVYKLGKGPAIGKGPNLHRGLTDRLIKISKDEGIPYQIDIEPGNTGTEAWGIQVSRSGIPTVLISVPLRYMHTPVETLQIQDIENAGRLVSVFIKEYNGETEAIGC